MTTWVNATGEAGEASNLNDLETRIKTALPAFSQHAWTQKTSASALSAANLNALELLAATGGGHIVSVKASPYLAVGNGIANDTAAIQAAINAVSAAGGGIVWFPPGTYKCTASLTIPTTAAQVTLMGASIAVNSSPCASNIIFSDLGAGAYLIKPADTNTPAGVMLEGLYVTTGLESLTMGVTPAATYGIQMASNWKIRNCRVGGTKAGLVFLRDHNLVDGCYISNNFYNLYWGPGATSNGDHRIINSEIESASFSNVAVATDNFIDGCLFSSVHMGNSPFCFWKEGNPPSNPTFIYNSEFIDVAAEGWGNAIISSERGTTGSGARVLSSIFIGCDNGSAYTPTFALAGFAAVSDRVFIAEEVAVCVFQGGGWHASGAAHVTNGLYKTSNWRRNFLDYIGAVAGPPTNYNWGTGTGLGNRFRWPASDQAGPTAASASSILLPPSQGVVRVTGTTTIDSITLEPSGTEITLLFGTNVTVNDSTGNLKLAGNFVATADDTLSLAVYDTNYWVETGRSAN